MFLNILGQKKRIMLSAFLIFMYIYIYMTYLNKTLLLLMIVIIIQFLICFFLNDKFSLICLILSLAMDKVSITIGGITFTIGMILVMLNCLKLLIKGDLIRFNNLKSKTFRKIIPIEYMLMLSITLSALLAADKISALSRVFQFIFLITTAYIIYIYTIKFNPKLIIKYIIVSGLINLLLGILQFGGYYKGININSIFRIFNKLNGRAYYGISLIDLGGIISPRMNGFFVDPAPFAGYMLTILCLIFAIDISSITKKKILGSLIFSLSIVLSFSRSAWLGLLLTFFLLILYVNSNNKINRLKLNLFVGISILIFIIIFKDKLYLLIERVFQTFDESDISTAGHKNMAVFAIEAFKSSPLFGLGLNNFKDFVGFNTMTHSMYLTFLCETGISGFIFYFSIWIVILRRLWQIIKNKSYNGEAIALFFVLISILISNISYDYYNQLFIWAYIGLAIAIIDRDWGDSDEKKMYTN